MPYIGNTTSDFSIDTGNITNRAVTATKLSPSSVGSNGQVLSVDGSGNLQWSTDAALTLIDEDNMSSNSASSVPSQQSVKAYADTKAVLTGSTNNTITTVTGANALIGESTLTYNNGKLSVTGASGNTQLSLTRSDANSTGTTGTIGFYASDDHAVAGLYALGDGDNEGAHLIFKTTSAASGTSVYSDVAERLRITSDGVALFNGLTSQGTEDTSKLAVQGGDSNIGIIQVHAGGGESDGDLSGITFSHGANNATARAKGAIALRCDGSGYGRGDLCFYVDGTGDNNQVAVADERIRIKSDGKLLVGSTTHNTTLDIVRFHRASGHTSLSLTCGSNSDVGIHLKQSIREWKIFNDGDLRFYNLTDSAEGFRVTSSGNLGIGTTNPDGVLHISSGTSGDCKLIIEADTDNNEEADNPQIWFKQDGDITTSFIGQTSNALLIANSVDNNGGVIFKTGTTNNSGTTDPLTDTVERLRITSAGYVNIGNVGANATHHASGLFNGVIPKFEVKLGGASNSYTRYINIANPGAQTGSETLGRVGIKLSLGSEASSGESNKSGAIYAESTSGYNNGTNLCFGTGGAERMRITSGGALGINTTSPQQASLPSIHLHGSANDDARIAITTPNKTDGRIGYYGLSNRFGIDMYNGFQIRDVADSYATRFMVISNGNTSIGTDNSNSRLTLSSGSSSNAVSIRNTTAGNGHVGILFSTQDSSTGREKVAIYHQETHGEAHYAGDLVYCMNNATGGATQVGISDERFRMKRDGRFEIKASNTSTAYDEPLLKVQLSGDSTTDKTFISLWNGNNTGDISTETSHIDFVWQDSNTNVKPQARISGNVGDGTDSNSQVKEGKGFLTFHCSNTAAGDGDENPPERLKIAHDGTFSGSGSNNISDQRLKENITTITDATTKIKALTGRTFTWKAEADMQEGTKYGFIAQEVEPIVSDLVCDWTGIRVLDKDGQITKKLTPDKSKGDSYAKSVNVEGVIPILVEALKEALTEIDTLKTKVAALEAA